MYKILGAHNARIHGASFSLNMLRSNLLLKIVLCFLHLSLSPPLSSLLPHFRVLFRHSTRYFFSLVLLRQRCSTHYITQIALFVIRLPPFFWFPPNILFRPCLVTSPTNSLVNLSSRLQLIDYPVHSFAPPLSKPFALGNLMRKVVSPHQTYSQIVSLNTP